MRDNYSLQLAKP